MVGDSSPGAPQTILVFAPAKLQLNQQAKAYTDDHVLEGVSSFRLLGSVSQKFMFTIKIRDSSGTPLQRLPTHEPLFMKRRRADLGSVWPFGTSWIGLEYEHGKPDSR